MEKINQPFTSIEKLQNEYRSQTKTRQPEAKTDFGAVLQQTMEQQTSDKTGGVGVKFSKHAANRLQEREIALSKEQEARLEHGVEKASEKGINESLIMIDSLVFIVNVPNKTVITAMDQMESDDSIFTNIDGAVIM